jgi:hypothetical protein
LSAKRVEEWKENQKQEERKGMRVGWNSRGRREKTRGRGEKPQKPSSNLV